MSREYYFNKTIYKTCHTIVHGVEKISTPSAPKYLQHFFTWLILSATHVVHGFCTRVGLVISESHSIDDEYKTQSA